MNLVGRPLVGESSLGDGGVGLEEDDEDFSHELLGWGIATANLV